MIRLAYIFGDSVMKGVVLDKQTKHYTVLETVELQRFEQTLQTKLVNRSCFGCTIQKGSQMVHRMVAKCPDMNFAILEYGGNDCDFDWNAVRAAPTLEHQPKTPLPLFEKIYADLIAFLKAHHILPIVMNLPPVDGNRYLDFLVAKGLNRENLLTFLRDPGQISRYQELYSLRIERLAHENGAILVDCRSRFLGTDQPFSELLCEDGLHPTARGHQLISDSFADALAKLPDDIKARILPRSERLRTTSIPSLS